MFQMFRILSVDAAPCIYFYFFLSFNIYVYMYHLFFFKMLNNPATIRWVGGGADYKKQEKNKWASISEIIQLEWRILNRLIIGFVRVKKSFFFLIKQNKNKIQWKKMK